MEENLQHLKVYLGNTSLDFYVSDLFIKKFESEITSQKADWVLVPHSSGKNTQLRLSTILGYEVSKPKILSTKQSEGLVQIKALANFFGVLPIRITRNCKSLVETNNGKRKFSRANIKTALELRQYLLSVGEKSVPSEAEINKFFGSNKKK